MIDIILIKLMLNRIYFTKYHSVINLEFYKNNSREVYKIFLSLFKLQESSDKDYSIEDLSMFFHTQYPMMKDAELILIDAIFKQVEGIEIDENLAVEYLNKHHEQTIATQIALASLEVAQGRSDMGTVRALIESIDKPIESAKYNIVSNKLTELLADINSGEGLRWRLDTLNKSLGSLRKGDFGFIVKRPETGGTTFLASEVSHMLQQGDKKVLWCNNEEQGSKVNIRVYQAYFEATYKEIQTNQEDYENVFMTEVGNKFTLFDETTMNKRQIEELCEIHKPNLIIFDQIDKIKGFPNNEREDIRLGSIYIWARELAKKYAPVIAVTQASGEAEGKKYLTMDMIANSKTAKAAEADWILGIGMTHYEGEEFNRYFSIMKNKLLGDSDSLPTLRHGKMPVAIHPDIARFSDSIKWS